MSNFDLSRELALKYSFETFDFKSNSPEDLVIHYRNIYEQIDTALTYQITKTAEESLKSIDLYI